MMRRGRAATVAGVALAAVLGLAAVAGAQGGLELDIQQTDLESDGTTQVMVSVQAALGGHAARVGVQRHRGRTGRRRRGGDAHRGRRAGRAAIRRCWSFDACGSTEGAPIEAARTAAATSPVPSRRWGSTWGWSRSRTKPGWSRRPHRTSGSSPMRSRPSRPVGRRRCTTPCSSAAPRCRTSPGSRVHGRVLRRGRHRQHATLQAAETAAGTAGAAVSTVALETEDLDLPALQQLSDRPGASCSRAANTGELAGGLRARSPPS